MPSGVMVGNYCGFLTIWCVSKDPSSPPPQHDRVVFQTLHSCLMDHIWWISVVSSEFSIAVHFQVLSISLGWNEITWQLLSRRIWTQKRESQEKKVRFLLAFCRRCDRSLTGWEITKIVTLSTLSTIPIKLLEKLEFSLHAEHTFLPTNRCKTRIFEWFSNTA